MRSTRSLVRALGLLAAALLLALVVPTAPAGSAPYCGITWGSLRKTSAVHTGAPITNLRAGRHTCFDRLVIDVDGAISGYTVAYVPTVSADPSGIPIPTRGGAALQITVNAPSYTQNYVPTYYPADRLELTDVTGYRTFRQVAWGGSYEARTSVGLGVRARLPFRVFVLDGPGRGSRLVVDVAHRR